MNKHEEAKQRIMNFKISNITYENYKFFTDYISQQEKKDELIDKLYQEELNKPLKKNGKRGYTNSTRLRILKQIKALEEEMK